ncbi:MAG: TniB family NTP-binding protein [Pseudomonadota bacterium]
MKRSNAEILDAPINWDEVSLEERRKVLNAIFVPRTFTTEFVNAMQDLRDGCKEGAEAMCLVVVGEKGVGKSAFLKVYALENPREVIEDDNVVTITRPVVYVSFPPSPTLKGSAEVFLEALAGKGSVKGSRTALTQRIKDLLVDLKTELVIADEFQHVREDGAKGRSAVADWLKDILKVTNVPFVLAGMPETIQIIEADEQLHSLTEEPTVITKYDWEDPASRKAWRAILAKIDLALPFNHRSDLAAQDTARALFLCCDGNLRRLRAILRIAVGRALRNGGKLVVWDDLAAGYDRLPKLPRLKGNPFDLNGLFKR